MRGHPDPAAYELRPVRAGEEYSRSVEGGFRRAKAPQDGLILEQEDRTIFLPLPQLMAAIAQIAPRAAPRRHPTMPYPPARGLPGGDDDE